MIAAGSRDYYLDKLWSLLSGGISNRILPSIMKHNGDDNVPPSIILPYLGETPIEVVLFVGTSSLFRSFMWWRRTVRRCHARDDNDNDDSSLSTRRMIKDNKKKSTVSFRNSNTLNTTPIIQQEYNPQKDPGLYAFFSLVYTMTSHSGRGNIDNKQPLLPKSIELPYIGDTPIEVLLFVGTSIWFRCTTLWWGRWKRTNNDNDDSVSEQQGKNYTSRHYDNNNNNNKNKNYDWRDDSSSSSSTTPDGRATQYKPYRDPSLYAFIDMTQQQKSKLRMVPNPEEMKRERLQQLKEEQKKQPSGPLGLSEHLLQMKRSSLRNETKRS